MLENLLLLLNNIYLNKLRVTYLGYKRRDKIFYTKKLKYRIYIKIKGKRLDLQGIEYLEN